MAAGAADPQLSGTRLGEAGYQDLVRAWNRLGCAVWVRDGTGCLCYANPAARELFGLPAGSLFTTESLGWDLFDEDGQPLPAERFPALLAYRTGTPQRHRTIGITVPGRPTQWVMMDCTPSCDAEGRVLWVVGMAVDITTFKQAQLALRGSEDRYRRMLEAMHEGCCLVGPDSTITFVNRRLCEMLGYRAEELLGRRSVDVLGASSSALDGGRHAAAASQRDVPVRHKDGSVVWASISGTPMLDDDGHTIGILAMFADVTQRKRSEERAVAAAAQIERLTADAIYTVDAQRRLRSWNRGAERLFGWTKEEAIGQLLPLIPPDLVEAAQRAIQRIVADGVTVTRESVRLTKAGQPVPVLGSWSPVPLEDGSTGVLCILKDLSKHRAIHDQLQEQARSLALLRERERIAMDLHDGVTQSLYGVTLSLGALRRRSADASYQEAVLGGAIAQLTEIIQGIRHYIFELRTGVPEGTDLQAGLQAKAGELAATIGLRPRLAIEADLSKLTPEQVSHLLYIVHEALSNVARHARASEAAIEVLPFGSGIMLRITDNGRGFDSGHRGRRAGDGLRNMRERAAQLGATLIIDSLPGTGTTVRVQVP